MPIVDGVFVPSRPLTPAELHVDFAAHNTHVLDRRAAVERMALPAASRVARQAALIGDQAAASRQLADTLARALSITAKFGFDQAVAEIDRMRTDDVLIAAANPPAPPASTVQQLAQQGLSGISRYMQQRAAAVANDVVKTVLGAVRANPQPAIAVKVAKKQAQRTLHNGVLELVGLSLNLGRSAGAASVAYPPIFAFRSEQLDETTCGPCDVLHGTIVQFGTPLYFAKMPPSGCRGGGRCRGVYVFADGPRQMHVSDQLLAA